MVIRLDRLLLLLSQKGTVYLVFFFLLTNLPVEKPCLSITWKDFEKQKWLVRNVAECTRRSYKPHRRKLLRTFEEKVQIT